MNIEIRKSLRLLLLYFFITSITGIIRSEIFLRKIDSDLRSIARISSCFSNIISCFIAFLFIIALNIVFFNFLKFFNNRTTLKDYYSALKLSVYVLITGEIIKLIVALLFLPDEIEYIDYQKDINTQLQSTGWNTLNTYINYIIIVAYCATTISTLRMSKKNSVLEQYGTVLISGFFISNRTAGYTINHNPPSPQNHHSRNFQKQNTTVTFAG